MTQFDPKKLGEEADELIRKQAEQEGEGETPEETPELTSEDDTGTDDAIAQADSTPATDQGTQSEEIPSDDVVDNSKAITDMQKQLDAAEQRWKVLQGMIDKKDRELDTMRDLLATVSKPAPQEVAAPVVDQAQPLVSDEDIKEYGKDYADFITRVSRQASREELSASQLLSSIDARLKNLEGSVEGVEITTANTAQNVFFSDLTSLVPDWKMLNNDPSFLQWLDQVDPFAGEAKLGLLQHAVSAGDATRAAKFFETYKLETTPEATPEAPAEVTPPASSGKDKLIAPGKATATTVTSDEKRNWTTAQINKLYDDKMAGKITTKEFDKLERDLFAAQSEGRIAA